VRPALATRTDRRRQIFRLTIAVAIFNDPDRVRAAHAAHPQPRSSDQRGYFRFFAARFFEGDFRADVFRAEVLLADALRFLALRVVRLPLVSSWLRTEAASFMMSCRVASAPVMMRDASRDSALLDCLAMMPPCPADPI
jgi:hypothetical protein